MVNINITPRCRVTKVRDGIYVKTMVEAVPDAIQPDPVYRCLDCGEEGVTPDFNAEGMLVADGSHKCKA